MPMGSRNRTKSDRPKALTVRLNFAKGPMVESRGQKFCRVTLGTRQHDTPKRCTTSKGSKSVVEWNCILVYPYTTEKWLKIEMRDDTGLDRLACSIFDLSKLKQSESRQFKGELELDDGSCLDADIAFFPRPSSLKSTAHNTTSPRPTTSTPPASLLTTMKPEIKEEEDEESKLESLVNQTIRFFGNESENGDENELSKGDPVMITIGNPNGPIYHKVEVDPDKSLFPRLGPHRLGVESLWVDMAGGTVFLQGGQDDKNDNNAYKASMWNELATPEAKVAPLKSSPLANLNTPSTTSPRQAYVPSPSLDHASIPSAPIPSTPATTPGSALGSTPGSAPGSNFGSTPGSGFGSQHGVMYPPPPYPMYPVPNPYGYHMPMPLHPSQMPQQMGSAGGSTAAPSSTASMDSNSSNPVPAPHYSYPPYAMPYPPPYAPGYGYPAPPMVPSFDPRLVPQVQPSSMRLEQQQVPQNAGSGSFENTHNLPVWHGGAHHPTCMTVNKAQRSGSDSDEETNVRRLHTRI